MKYVSKTFMVELQVADGETLGAPLRGSEDVWHSGRPL
jgi:hypothetical protein